MQTHMNMSSKDDANILRAPSSFEFSKCSHIYYNSFCLHNLSDSGLSGNYSIPGTVEETEAGSEVEPPQPLLFPPD